MFFETKTTIKALFDILFRNNTIQPIKVLFSDEFLLWGEVGGVSGWGLVMNISNIEHILSTITGKCFSIFQLFNYL